MAELSEEKKRELAAVVLLDKMREQGYRPPMVLEGADAPLESLLEWMLTEGYATATPDGYAMGERGAALRDLYQKRYTEFLNVFDVFSAVDLAAGEFAFEKYLDMDDGDWRHYLALDRWDDLRVAVAKRKGIDPLDIVFFDMIRNGRFDTRREGWQFDLVLGGLWSEAVEICETAIQVEQLGYEWEGEAVPGENVIRDVIAQGVELNMRLKEREREMVRRGELRAPKSAMSAADLAAHKDPDFKSALWN